MKLCKVNNLGFRPLVQYYRDSTILHAGHSSPTRQKNFQLRPRNLQTASLSSPNHKSCLCTASSNGFRLVHGQPSFSTGCEKLAAHYNTFDDQPHSWLFVSNAVAGAYGAQVNLDLDLDRRIAPGSVSTLQANVDARGMDLDMKELVSIFKQFMSLKTARQALDDRKFEILRLLKEVKIDKSIYQSDATAQNSCEQMDKATVDSLVSELRQNKKDMKKLMKSLWDFEAQVMTTALRLPNDLHPNTPLERTEVKREANKDKANAGHLTHVEIAKKYDLIKFRNVGPKAYYLKRKLASAEMLLTDVATDFFHRQGYRLMFGPEFFKTPIMEGCGLDVNDTNKVLTLQHTSRDIEPMLHLAGVSSMTFAAYLARLNIASATLPLRMFSMGRTYQKGSLPGLFGATQSTQVGVFSCASQSQAEEEFDCVTQAVWDLVQSFGFHVRLCDISSKKLHREERRRAEIQLFAPSLGDFVPVARISDLGDFVSRRLMTSHSDNHSDFRQGKLVHMISGTALNVTSFLAVWMELSSSRSEAKDEFVLQELPPLKTLKKTARV